MLQKYSILVLLLFAACACPCEQYRTASGADARNAVITLQRTACFGKCPTYSVRISGDGRVVYEGGMFVKVAGRQETTISPENLVRLVNEIEKCGYFSLNNEYADKNLVDVPAAFTSVALGAQNKSITHYRGHPDAPRCLTDIENLIDEVAQTAQWVRGNP